ncbi:hypothetical protein Tco_1078749, partial [Tanacetum coccineum]
MAALRYRDEHNKVGYLQKPIGSDDYHQILDFLRASHIRYALTNNPIIFDSLVKQFGSTATLRSPELGPSAILATIDKTPYIITEDSVRRQLQLADDGGIDDLPITEIYSGLDNLGYVTEGKLTFFKNKFSPQWRFLVHTILHCFSTKSGSWDQFGSSLAVALICLSDGRRFNWSSYIFKGMVSNIGNAKKFLMYPRFLQTILGTETRITRKYNVFKLSSKLFANMKLNFEGQPMPLLAVMFPQVLEGECAGVAAKAVPQPIPEPIHVPIRQPSGVVEDPLTLTTLSSFVSKLMQKTKSLESELKDTKETLRNAIITLVRRVKKLEGELKRRKRKSIISDFDDDAKRVEQDIDMASRGRTTEDASSKMDFSQDRDTLVGITDSSAAKDIPAVVSIPPSTSTISPGNSTVPPGNSTIPTSSSIPASDPVSTASTPIPTGSVPITTDGGSIPAAEPITPRSSTTPATPSSPVRDARKGKVIAVDEPTPTQERSFKQLEDERLGWEAAQRLHAQEQADMDRQRAESIMKDANLARQMSQDLEMSKAQRKQQQEILASATHYSDGVDATDDTFVAKMVALVKNRRNEFFVQRIKELRERPMTPAQLRHYMRTYVKNQSSAIYSTGWTMAQKLRSSEVVAPSQDVPEEEVEGYSLSKNVAEAEVHTQGVPIEDIEVPSTATTEVQKEDSSIKRVGTK